MCKHGEERIVRVLISAELSHTGKAHWKNCPIDGCIADLVQTLQEEGINMTASCCGHGKGEGRIDLADGRILIIKRGGTGMTGHILSLPFTSLRYQSHDKGPSGG